MKKRESTNTEKRRFHSNFKFPTTMANFYDYNNSGGQQTGGGNSGGGFYDGGFNQQQQQQPQQPGGGSYGYGGANNGQQQQWSQQQQQQPYPGQQQQQAQPQQPGFFSQQGVASVMANPNVMAAMSGGLNNDAMFKIASAGAENMWKSGAGKFIPGLETSMLTLRRYFAVDNYYVKAKILKVLFPFRSKNWKRVVSTAMLYFPFLVVNRRIPLMCLCAYSC